MLFIIINNIGDAVFLMKKNIFLILFFLTHLVGMEVYAEETVPIELKDVGIKENLGGSIPLDTEFVNEDGKSVPLSSFFENGKPKLLTLVYYQCPSLCNFILNGLLETLIDLEWEIGSHFDILTISIDPLEGSKLAFNKRKSYLKEYGRPHHDSWHFLTGSEKDIKKVSDSVGFLFKYDERQDEYAHTAAIFVLTPDGKISRYLYGIDYKPQDVKLALLEAADGKIGTLVDRFLLFCYHYDPIGKKYSLFATNILKLAAIVTIVIIAGMLLILSRKKKRAS